MTDPARRPQDGQTMKQSEVPLTTDEWRTILALVTDHPQGYPGVIRDLLAAEARREAPQLKGGHIDADCEVVRGVGAFCTCSTEDEKAEAKQWTAECEAEREGREAPPPLDPEKRLRSLSRHLGCERGQMTTLYGDSTLLEVSLLLREAADEIERLRSALPQEEE